MVQSLLALLLSIFIYYLLNIYPSSYILDVAFSVKKSLTSYQINVVGEDTQSLKVQYKSFLMHLEVNSVGALSVKVEYIAQEESLSLWYFIDRLELA